MSDKDKSKIFIVLIVAIGIYGIVLTKAVDGMYQIKKIKIENSVKVVSCESK